MYKKKEKKHTKGQMLSNTSKTATHRRIHEMFDVEGLKRLQDDLWVEEWRRVHRVRVWSIYADCRERERHGHYGWRRPLVIWTGALKERRSEREQRRAWFKRMSAAREARAEHTWHMVANGGETREFLEGAVKDLIIERKVYVEIEAVLGQHMPPELVRVVWTMMQMDDAWGQLDASARIFLWRVAAEADAERCEKVQAPWRLSWQRDRARARWTRLLFGLRKAVFNARGHFWQGQALGYWDVLSPWRAGWQPWRVAGGR